MDSDSKREPSMATKDPPSGRKDNPEIFEWEGPGPLPLIPDVNFSVYILDIIAKYGDDVAIIDAETEEQRTFSFLHENVPRVAGGLRASGVAQGDVVVMVSPNHVDFPLVLLSVMLCGATFAPVNPDLTAEELCQVIREHEVQWLVCHHTKLKMVEEAEISLKKGTLLKVWVLDDDAQCGITQDCLSVEKLSSLLVSTPITPLSVDNRMDSRQSVAMMLFSSGTTGRPKGVMLSHTNILVMQITNSYMNTITKDRKPQTENTKQSILIIVPMYHTYGYLWVMGPLVLGVRAVFLRKFSPKKYLETIETFKITWSPVVPHIASFLTKTPLLEEYDTSSVIAFSSSSAPLGAETSRAFQEKTGRTILCGYGLTECGGVAANGEIYGYKCGSVGKVMPNVKVKVIDVENGDLLSENKEGEVCVQGPGVMLGYAKNPEATRSLIDEDGWLHTGDVGYFDEDHFLFITDRIKDLIKVKGFQNEWLLTSN